MANLKEINNMKRFIQYIRETKAEMAFVKWPTKKQAMTYTAVVVVISLIIAIFLGVFDKVFLKIVSIIINR